MNPIRTSYLVGGTEPLGGGRAKSCPCVHFRRVGRRVGKRVNYHFGTVLWMSTVPTVHKVSQGNPGVFSLANLFKGKAHGLELSSCSVFHALSCLLKKLF